MNEQPNDEFFACELCNLHALHVGLEAGGGATMCLRDADKAEALYIQLSKEDCIRLAKHLLAGAEQD